MGEQNADQLFYTRRQCIYVRISCVFFDKRLFVSSNIFGFFFYIFVGVRVMVHSISHAPSVSRRE